MAPVLRGSWSPNRLGQYRTTCQQAWTGDADGREWRLSWVVVRTAPAAFDDLQGPWAVYSDDAVPVTGLPPGFEDQPARNGDFEAGFDTFEEACAWADERAQLADV